MGEQTDKDVAAVRTPGIVVRGGPSRWRGALKFGGVVLGVLVLSVAAGAGVRWYQNYNTQKKAAQPDAVAVKAEQAQNLALNGKYDEADKQINDALKNKQLKPAQKAALYFQQGINYENEQKYQQAMDSYKRAEALDPTKAVAEAMARVATTMGDKQAAISYYQKAIARINKSSPTAEQAKVDYEAAIAALKQEQPSES